MKFHRNRPNISVLMAAFNAEHTVKAALDSVLAQTVKANQVLVVDDGSTDKTAEIVQGFFPKVELIRTDNRGIGAARNLLIRNAMGNYLAFLDSDDVWCPQYLELQSQALEQHPDAIMAFSRFQCFVGSLFPPDLSAHQSLQSSEVLGPREFLTRYKRASGIAIPSFSMIRSDAFQKLRDEPFPTVLRSGEDTYLFYRLALLGPFLSVRNCLGGYRRLNNGLSSQGLSSCYHRVLAMEIIVADYRRNQAPRAMLELVCEALEQDRRRYARYLMAAKRFHQARELLCHSIKTSGSLKSLTLLLLSYSPRRFQASWSK